VNASPPNTWARFYFELHASAVRLRELMDRLAADQSTPAEIAEMARSYGISGELLLSQFVAKKTTAQEALGARQKTIEATRRAAEQQAGEARLSEAVASRDYSTIIQVGKDKSNPALQAVARAAMATA
jgi:hypothetical protein